MKKLFLYLLLYAAIFFIAYNIFFDFAKSDMEDKGIVGSTAEAVSDNDIISDTVSDNISDTISDTISAGVADIRPRVQGQAVMLNFKPSDKYIVGLKNNYVIVYKNDKSLVYEYTDIDGSVIKANDNEAYEMLLDDIEFENKEDMFDFLESLSS